MRGALFLLLAAAAVLAWIVARRRPAHRPLAIALTAALFADLARAALLAWVLPAPQTNPLEGALRLAVFAERLLVLAWPFALAGAAVRVLARRAAWPIAIGYVLAAAVLIVGYPALRFGALRRSLLAIDLLVLLVGVGALMTWWRRAARLDERGDVSIRTGAALVLGQGVSVLSAHSAGLFGDAWTLGRAGYLAVLSGVIAIQLGEVFARADS